MFAAFALLSALDRTNGKRFGNAAFWGLLAVSFFAGDSLGDFGNGILVLCLVGLAGFHALGRGDPPTTTDGERIDYSKRSEEHTSELQSLMRISYAVFCLK